MFEPVDVADGAARYLLNAKLEGSSVQKKKKVLTALLVIDHCYFRDTPAVDDESQHNRRINHFTVYTTNLIISASSKLLCV